MTANEAMKDRIGGIETGLLVAYADGALPPERARAVEVAIRDNPEAQKALSLMRHSAAAVRHAFDVPLGETVPEQLRSVLDRRAGTRSSLAQRLLPLAASIVALAIGLGGGYLIGRPAETGSEIRLAAGPASATASAFNAALVQALAGGQPVVEYTGTPEGPTGTITLLGTLETSFGTACREFRHVANVLQPSTTTENGLACQRADGGWEVSILTSVSS